MTVPGSRHEEVKPISSHSHFTLRWLSPQGLEPLPHPRSPFPIPGSPVPFPPPCPAARSSDNNQYKNCYVS